MSASIFWRPVPPKEGTRLVVYGPSAFLTNMEKVFGSSTPTLEVSDVPRLRAMAAMNSDGGGNPYADIADAVEKHGAVELWATY